MYYISDVSFGLKFSAPIWSSGDHDIKMLKRGLVFKTKEEAIELTDKILKFVKDA